MKLEKYIARWYRFSSLREIGKVGFIAMIPVVLLGIWAALSLSSPEDVIAEYDITNDSYLTVDALHVKNDDTFFHLFLEKIRKNDDVLVLGTSESGFMDSYNYWELLNADTEIEERFGALYGAGRSCERYIPSMLNYPENWKGQELIVLINPVYWRQSLSRFNMEYHTRYMNNRELRTAREASDRKEDFDLLFSQGATGVVKAQMDELNHAIDKKIHTLFYERIRNLIGWKSEKVIHLREHADYVEVQNRLTPKILNDFKTEILPEFNSTQHFIDQGNYTMNPLILDATYRNTAMDYFMDLCRQLDIKVTFVLGPYNKILADKCGQSDVIQQHEQLEDQLRSKFEEEGFDYIDATHISTIPGSFLDKQHHSKFGGYLLYQCIKDNWHE